MTTSSRTARHSRFLLAGVLPFDMSRVPADALAGATLAALAIPETMGYAKMAGMPVITGLYTILIPIFLFALFGSSRHLVVGADSATAVVLAAGLAGMGLVAASTEYVAMAALAALLVGAVLLAARLLRLGFIANFLSRSVLVGFLTGVGIQVAMGQLAGVLGVSDGTGSTLAKFATTLRNIPDTSVPTLLLALLVWAIVIGSERINPKIPGALIAVVLTIGAGMAGVLPAAITLLGSVPGGLPPIGLPSGVLTVANVAALSTIVFSCFIIILAQSAATSRAYAAKYTDSFDENVDLVGLAAANLGAALSGTFVVNGSPTKTEMVDGAGGRTQVAQLSAGILVLAVLLFLTGPLAYLPNVVLSAIVLLIGLKLVNLKGMRAIASVRTGEFAVATVTAGIVVVAGVEQAILAAIVLSVVEHLSHSYRPYDITLAKGPDGHVESEPVAGGPILQARPGLVIYRFGGGLYYANAARFIDEVTAILEAADPPLKWLCLSGAVIGDVDYSGAEAVRQVITEARERDVKVVACEIQPALLARTGHYGLVAELASVYDHVEDVLAAYDAEAAGAASASLRG